MQRSISHTGNEITQEEDLEACVDDDKYVHSTFGVPITFPYWQLDMSQRQSPNDTKHKANSIFKQPFFWTYLSVPCLSHPTSQTTAYCDLNPWYSLLKKYQGGMN